jgi:hypothetical protein
MENTSRVTDRVRRGSPAELRYHRAYYRKHRRRLLDQQRDYNQKHKAEIRRRHRAYYLEHRDEILAKGKAERAANSPKADRVRAQGRKYHRKHRAERNAKNKAKYYANRDTILADLKAKRAAETPEERAARLQKARNYYAENKEHCRRLARRSGRKNRKKKNARSRAHYHRNRDRILAAAAEARKILRGQPTGAASPAANKPKKGRKRVSPQIDIAEALRLHDVEGLSWKQVLKELDLAEWEKGGAARKRGADRIRVSATELRASRKSAEILDREK